MADVSPFTSTEAIPTFNRDEIKAMINTAHQYGVKIAAHASSEIAIRRVLELGIDSVEHGNAFPLQKYDPYGAIEYLKVCPDFIIKV